MKNINNKIEDDLFNGFWFSEIKLEMPEWNKISDNIEKPLNDTIWFNISDSTNEALIENLKK